MDRRAMAALALASLLGAAGYADAFLGDLARSNLSNEGFRRVHERTPADLGLEALDVRIPSSGLGLAGWWIAAPDGAANATTAIVLVHGVGSTMGKVVRMWAPSLHAAGYSVLAFDLRNHGASPDAAGGLVTYGVDEAGDVAAAVAYVRANAGSLGVDADRIVPYGGSMGAASVLQAAAQGLPGVRAVVADSAYASFAFQARIDGEAKGYPAWLVDLVVARMDGLAPSPPSHSRPEDAVGRLPVPALLLHCLDDARVTAPNLHRLLAAAPAGTEHWAEPCPTGLSRERHLDGFMRPGYNATVLRFLGRVLAA